MDNGSWQPDPTQRHEVRWWTGTQWSDQVADHGVASSDPLHPLAAPAAAPTAPTPVISPSTPIGGAAPPAASAGRARTTRTLVIAGAAVGLLAVVAAVTFVLTRGDDGSKVGAATTVVTAPATSVPIATTSVTVMPSTPAPTTAVPSTSPPPPSTVGGEVTVDTLLAALPTDDDVPIDWVRYSDATTDMPSGSGVGLGFCGGDNAVARAIDNGSTAYVDGPSWDLPNGGWFGVTVYSFPTDEDAATYLAGTEQAANGCMTDPPQYDTTEGDLDFFDESVADDQPWHVAEGSTAIAEPTADAAELLRTVQDSYASTTLDGFDYSVTMSYLSRLERHGRVVLKFWLYGTWDYQGWDEATPWAYQPDDAGVDDATAAVRPVIVERLRNAGVL
ncbi:MAG: DUF2510 domain-containing protein [Ilumatobacteraceae bacterium]